VHKYTAHENDVYDPVRWRPVAITRDDNDGAEHERETIVDRAKAAHESQCVAITDQKRERIPSLWTCKVMRC